MPTTYRYLTVPATDCPYAEGALLACRWAAEYLGLSAVPDVHFFRADGDAPVELALDDHLALTRRILDFCAGDAPEPTEFVSQEQAIGLTRGIGGGIWVKADLSGDQIIQTVLHETFHVYQFELEGNWNGRSEKVQRERTAEDFARANFTRCLNHMDDHQGDD